MSWLIVLMGLAGAFTGKEVGASALDWQQGRGFRHVPLPKQAPGRPGFTFQAAQATGVTFTNYISESRHLTNQILLNGAGVAAGDVDGDGWCDVYFCGLESDNALYRNLGSWKFEDITATAEVACAGLHATGAAFADLDGDGDLDLIVNSAGGGTHVYLNDGKAHFKEITPAAGLNPGRGGMSIAVGDVDGDGFLDFYAANYRTSALMDMPNARATFKVINGRNTIDRINGRPMTDPEFTNRFVMTARGSIEEFGEADVLFHNQGGTNFVPVSFTGGAFLDEDGRPLSTPPFDWGLSVMIRDLNADGLPDIYVCNDFESPDRIWMNQGGGVFRAAPRLAFRKSSMFSMGVDVADINRDGHDDIFVLDMLNRSHRLRTTQMEPLLPPLQGVGEIDNRPQYMMNTLFLNHGDGTYAEIAQVAGVQDSGWSWTPIFLDVDLDGWEDLLVSAGQERAARDLDVADKMRALRASRRLTDMEIFQARKLFPRLTTGNLAYRNRGDLTFEEVTALWGFELKGISHGMALADLDNDGDLDVLINNFNAQASLLRNDASAARVTVRLRGQGANSHGIGAKVTVLGGAVPRQSQEILCGGRYLSSDEAARVFAGGTNDGVVSVEVRWPGGWQTLVTNVPNNALVEISQPSGAIGQKASPSQPQRLPGLFAEVPSLTGFSHKDEPFDDFARQPLLPIRMSQFGPGVSWIDVDGDAWEDLVIGSGQGGELAVFRNDTKGGFAPWREAPVPQPVTRDQTSVLGWRRSANELVLLAGSSNYEDGLAAGAAVRGYNLRRKVVEDLVPAGESSPGALAMADVDGDGQLDLFVAGCVVPGKFPAAAVSLLYLNRAGKFEPDAANNATLAGAGMVNGAVFSDLDGDGDPDLILACAWAPVRILRNDTGKLVEITTELGLGGYLGWWNGVATVDVDGDGDMDIVATNWGRNQVYPATEAAPWHLFGADFDGNGVWEVIEAHHDLEMGKVVPNRQLGVLSAALPRLRERYPTHESFAQAAAADLLGEKKGTARHLQINWLDSTVFINEGRRFIARPLPTEAQLAPAFGVSAADFDGDGQMDLVLAQNFFAVAGQTPRFDAGRGLLLLGDGKGGFKSESAARSGLEIHGEQRGSAVADFDHDGRPDLVIGQNGSAARLYRNALGKPGIRVRLQGPAGNPDGIGWSFRIKTNTGFGPRQEAQCGSGWWSQDGTARVLSSREAPLAVEVRGPGKVVIELSIPAGAGEVEILLSSPRR